MQRTTATQQTERYRCFSGLSVVCVPVLVDGVHVATLLAGQVLRKKPPRRDLARVTRRLRTLGLNGQLPVARRALANTPVISEKQFQGMVELLGVFAKQLTAYAGSLLHRANGDDPVCVCAAKKFAQCHIEERITMRDAARHVHLSPYYFCKIFHKTTGLTFTDYVNRLRVEKAKGLLLNPFARVTEVAFDAGFQSISQFNTVFKKHAGHSPTAYRIAQRQ